MINYFLMHRRYFVKLSAFAAAAITLPLVPGCGDPIDRVESGPVFFSHLADIKTVKDTGKAYVSKFPRENSTDKLKDLLTAREGGLKDAGELRDALVKNIRADFKNNQVVCVNGWFLSRTEARQCALYYLINS